MLSFFPLDVLDEIWDLIESVSEGFLTYSYTTILHGASFFNMIQHDPRPYVPFVKGRWENTVLA